MEHYSAIKKNELLIDAITWMNFKIIRLSARNQSKKDTYYMIPFI